MQTFYQTRHRIYNTKKQRSGQKWLLEHICTGGGVGWGGGFDIVRVLIFNKNSWTVIYPKSFEMNGIWKDGIVGQIRARGVDGRGGETTYVP